MMLFVAFVVFVLPPYAQYEVLLVGEIIKIIYSGYQVTNSLNNGEKAIPRLQ